MGNGPLVAVYAFQEVTSLGAETQEKATSGRSAFVNESWNGVSSGRI